MTAAQNRNKKIVNPKNKQNNITQKTASSYLIFGFLLPRLVFVLNIYKIYIHTNIHIYSYYYFFLFYLFPCNRKRK